MSTTATSEKREGRRKVGKKKKKNLTPSFVLTHNLKINPESTSTFGQTKPIHSNKNHFLMVQVNLTLHITDKNLLRKLSQY